MIYFILCLVAFGSSLARVGFARVTLSANRSLGEFDSMIASPITFTLIVLVLSPGAKVTEPLAAWKSDPAFAVSSIVV